LGKGQQRQGENPLQPDEFNLTIGKLGAYLTLFFVFPFSGE